MSEKKSRVSRYQRLHVGVDEFKKQQVLNQERINRLHEMAQTVEVKSQEMVDVNKKASPKAEIEVMEAFAKEVNKTSEKNAQIFIVEEEKAPEAIVEPIVMIEEVEEDEIVEEVLVDDIVEEVVADEIVEEVVEEAMIEDVVEDEIIEEVVESEVVVAEVEEVTISEEKETVVKVKKKKFGFWHNFGIGFFTFCNVCALICFFVAYGPFHQIRDLFVTTAMSTMTKKYLANVLYSTETIQEILATNVTIEPNEVMDANAISIGQIKEPTMYSSVYEEQVLKRGEGEELYKIVRIDEHGYEGYAVFIYDPTKITVATTKYLGSNGGEFVTDLAKSANAAIAVNGGGFNNSGQPSGYVYKNGKIVWARNRGKKWGGGTIGFSKEGVMILTKSRGKKALEEGVYNGVDFGPFLIVNGKSAEVSGNGGWGVHPRTVIGQRKDGIVVLLVIDGRSASSRGIDLNTAIDIMKRYDVYNAANLDGGSSTTLVVKGKIINNPTSTTSSGQRYLPVALVVVDK